MQKCFSRMLHVRLGSVAGLKKNAARALGSSHGRKGETKIEQKKGEKIIIWEGKSTMCTRKIMQAFNNGDHVVLRDGDAIESNRS